MVTETNQGPVSQKSQGFKHETGNVFLLKIQSVLY